MKCPKCQHGSTPMNPHPPETCGVIKANDSICGCSSLIGLARVPKVDGVSTFLSLDSFAVNAQLVCYYCDEPAGKSELTGEDLGPLAPFKDGENQEWLHLSCYKDMKEQGGCGD